MYFQKLETESLLAIKENSQVLDTGDLLVTSLFKVIFVVRGKCFIHLFFIESKLFQGVLM
jgi:hypothetical protein